jgi:hypothetical protein
VESPNISNAAYIFGRGIIGEWTENLGLSCFRTKSLFDILTSVEVLCVSVGFRWNLSLNIMHLTPHALEGYAVETTVCGNLRCI